MEHWTVGHGTAFVLALVLVYSVWIPAKLIRTTHEGTELVLKFIFAVLTVILILSLASTASGLLGISGAFAAILGGLFGLQMAAMLDFNVQKEADKKAPEAEEVEEEEE